VAGHFPAYSSQRRELLQDAANADWLRDERPYTYRAVEARERIDDLLLPTPLMEANALIDQDVALFLKPEFRQRLRSFKIRGAANAIRRLGSDEHDTIATVSAGNHAQGVAYAAREAGKKAVVYMSELASDVKISAVRELGASVVLVGKSYDESYAAYGKDHVDQPEPLFIHPFDNFAVTTGASTQVLEVHEEQPRLDVAYMAVGGGGQFAASSAVMHELYGEGIEPVGVQLVGANAMQQSLKQKRLVELGKVNGFSDGTAVARAGEIPFDILSQQGRGVRIVSVTEKQLAQAMIDLQNFTGEPVEAAGALPLAGARQEKARLAGRRVCLFISGGNRSDASYARALELAAA
jgi:threonine dehydratase